MSDEVAHTNEQTWCVRAASRSQDWAVGWRQLEGQACKATNEVVGQMAAADSHLQVEDLLVVGEKQKLAVQFEGEAGSRSGTLRYRSGQIVQEQIEVAGLMGQRKLVMIPWDFQVSEDRHGKGLQVDCASAKSVLWADSLLQDHRWVIFVVVAEVAWKRMASVMGALVVVWRTHEMVELMVEQAGQSFELVIGAVGAIMPEGEAEVWQKKSEAE